MTRADSARFGAYWLHSKDMFDKLPDTKNEIFFLGNSITDFGEWSELLNDERCKNRGISGDVTEGILFRLGGITKCKPAKIFLLIGVNDLSKGLTDQEILANYRKILTRIKAESPATMVYVQSILPVNPFYNQYPNHTNKTERIKAINPELKKMASELGYRYVDLFSLMADKNDLLRKDLSLDGLHLNYNGYKIWVDAVRPLIKKK
jgi:lysophospholipase L1-like esterase